MTNGAANISSLDDRLRALTRVDNVMDRMVAAIGRVKSSQGSIVSLPKAELDLLAQIEIARDIMMEALKYQGDRAQLRDIFGGNCARIARIRAICESIEFSEMNSGDQRLRTCLRSCESVEKVLIDLGDGEALRSAQARLAEAIQQGSGLDVLSAPVLDEAASPEVSAPSRQRCGSGSIESVNDNTMDRCVERLLSLVRADAARMEFKLKSELAHCTEQLQKELTGCDKRLHEDLASFRSTIQAVVDKCEAGLASVNTIVDGLPVEMAMSLCQAEDKARQAEERSQRLVKESRSEVEHRISRVEIQMAVDAEAAEASFKNQLGELKSSISQEVAGRFQILETRLAELERSQSMFENCLTKHLETARCTRDELTRKLEDGLSSTRSESSKLRAELQEGFEKELPEQIKQVVTQAAGAAREAAASEVLLLQGSFSQILDTRTDELETMVHNLRRDFDIDSVWSSFAHVGDLIKDLECTLKNLYEPAPTPSPANDTSILSSAFRSSSVPGTSRSERGRSMRNLFLRE